ncbi:MAG: trehalose-phosphatase [Sphingomonadaceae bacterium]
MPTNTVLPPPPVITPATASLFLDFDGTIVQIADRPDAVIVSDALRILLTRLQELFDGRLAVVSGRSVATIRELVPDIPFAIAGSHGLELARADGQSIAPERPAILDAVLNEMRQFSEQNPGTLVEEKPLGAALHFRNAPETADACEFLVTELSARTGLALQPGHMVYELRPGNADKGTAIEAMMAKPPMHGTMPVFIGDDLTDEPAFLAASNGGGIGILVGPPRQTMARYGLPDVVSVLAWLERIK